MRFLTRLGVAAALCVGVSAPAHAIVFDFFWSSDSAADQTIISSDNDGITAAGTIEINVAAGSAFGIGDIGAVDIAVGGGGIAGFSFTAFTDAAGSVAVDGLSATFLGAGTSEPFAQIAGPPFFGCLFIGDCSTIQIEDANGALFDVDYVSSDAGLASMVMTAQNGAVVPLPATLPLALAGLAAFGFVARGRKKTG